MNSISIRFAAALLLIFIFTNCNKDKGDSLMNLLNEIPTDQYFDSDRLDTFCSGINGIWEAKTADNGFGQKYEPEFDYLLIKPNSIFGIVRNDTLVSHGKINIEESFQTRVTFEEMNPTDEDLIHFLNPGFLQCCTIDGPSLQIATCAMLSGHTTFFELKEE